MMPETLNKSSWSEMRSELICVMDAIDNLERALVFGNADELPGGSGECLGDLAIEARECLREIGDALDQVWGFKSC